MSGRLVSLSGYARSGKDTAAAGLVMIGWRRVAFADALKALALDLNPYVDGRLRLAEVVEARGWEGAKEIPEVRGTLQRLGVAARDHIHPDVWVRAALEGIGDADVVITDCRFPNELEAVKAAGGTTVRIDRPGVAPVNGHVSETALDGATFDRVLFNTGTPDELQAALLGAVT